MSYRRSAALLFPLAAAASMAACGGGGGVSNPISPTPTPVATATAPAISTPAPFSAATAAPLAAVTAPPAGQTPAPVPVPVPSSGVAGIAAAVSLPISGATSIAANTTAVVTLSSQIPTGAPTTFLRAHGMEAPQSIAPFGASGLVPLLFLQLAFSGGVSLANQPAISFQVPSNDIVSGASYYVALYDSTRPALGWQLGFEGPGTISGTTISFAGGSGAFSFTPFAPYVFALYAQSTAAATPTAPPTPTPTPPPTPPPTPTPPGATPTPIPTPQFAVSPSSISLSAVGATQTITATGAAPYLVFVDNSNVVTVTPSNGNSPFTATAVNAGSAQITIVDATGKQAIIPVTVTTVTVPVQ